MEKLILVPFALYIDISKKASKRSQHTIELTFEIKFNILKNCLTLSESLIKLDCLRLPSLVFAVPSFIEAVNKYLCNKWAATQLKGARCAVKVVYLANFL